jgi:tetratricopeptide (TPR) repeat protein
VASKITNITELFHRFHQCEMQLKQSKIAACLIAFREVIERTHAIPKTEKEKSELNQGIEIFLKNLSAHKKFQEIFGTVSFGDTDLETNLEFIKSMIVAQEEDIVERVRKDEEASETQRLEIDREKQRKQDEQQQKIVQAIELMDQENIAQAMEIINESEDIQEAVAFHYNDIGMQCRTDRSFAEAVKNYANAIMIAPKDENLLYNMGRAHFESGNLEKAEEFLSNAMNLNPNFNEGKIFYDYLLRVNSPQAESVKQDKKLSSFFKNLFHFRRKPKVEAPQEDGDGDGDESESGIANQDISKSGIEK